MKKAILVTLAVGGALAFLLAILLFLFPNHTANWDTEPVRLNVPQGCSYDALLDSLDAHQVVLRKAPVALVFNLEARVLGLDKHVRPGSYLVPRNMKILTLVRKLRNGQQDPIRLTIGKFRLPQDLNAYLNKKLMHDDFNVPLASFHLVLPDTYEFYWTVTPEQFMERMEKEYAKFWEVKRSEKGVKGSERTNAGNDTIVLPLTPSHSLSLQEIIILASIVEEETNHGPEKGHVASVYLNRLKRGMPLQADPTVKYAVATSCSPSQGELTAQQAEGFAIKRILHKHLATESPFNTYLHPGLPPAPICLPSKATIEAVLNAPQTDYLYFCASPAMDGTHRFAATLAEHNANAAAFHRALNARGIR